MRGRPTTIGDGLVFGFGFVVAGFAVGVGVPAITVASGFGFAGVSDGRVAARDCSTAGVGAGVAGGALSAPVTAVWLFCSSCGKLFLFISTSTVPFGEAVGVASCLPFTTICRFGSFAFE